MPTNDVPQHWARGLIRLDGENVLVIRLCVSHQEGEINSENIHFNY